MTTIITGSNGFIGRHLVPLLTDALPLDRHDFDHSDAELIARCQNATTFIHLAGRAHKHNEKAGVASMYHAENVLLTRRVLEIAKACSVTHFIFLSTSGVHGTQTTGKPFSELSRFHPQSPYALSKVQAETEVIEFCSEHNIAWTILRPPLVYGHRAPGHIGTLQWMMHKKIPIPFGATHNKRSLISVENLCDLIVFCTTTKQARNQIYLISDSMDRSTASLVRLLGRREHVKPWLLPLPVFMLKLISAALGLTHRFTPLWTDFEIDSGKLSHQLGWHPKRDP